MIDQSERIIEETRKRVEENRKRVIRYNVLMSLFFCLIVGGLGGAIYFYNQLRELNLKLKASEEVVQAMNDSLKTLSVELQQANERLNIQKDTLDKLIEAASKSNDPKSLLAPAVSKRDSARAYARIGYYKLRDGNLVEAKDAFNKSENFYNGYHDSYEVYFLLWKNRNNLNDPVIKKQLLEEIYNKYNSLGILRKQDIK